MTRTSILALREAFSKCVRVRADNSTLKKIIIREGFVAKASAFNTKLHLSKELVLDFSVPTTTVARC